MKKLTALASALVLILALTGCNKQMVDLTYSYERAVLSLPNGEVIEGKVSSWTDFEDGTRSRSALTARPIWFTAATSY